MSIRPVISHKQAVPTLEGAGVKLHRAFGFQNPEQFDPYLLFDDFRNERPEDYEPGFPWHPHRGIETITYVLDGSVAHTDSLGNQGTLEAGSVQWMTAGSGIMHQEMPKGNAHGRMHGFQLWANLPSQLKMTAPRYQDIQAQDIPEVIDDDGTRVRVIIGSFWGVRGPVDGVAANPQYLDFFIPPNTQKRIKIDTYQRTFAYIFQGAANFDYASQPQGVLVEKTLIDTDTHIRDLSGDRTLIGFDHGDEIAVRSGPDGVRFLLISGTPIAEPIAWHGPIVMNTRAQIQQAINDLRNDQFIKAD